MASPVFPLLRAPMLPFSAFTVELFSISDFNFPVRDFLAITTRKEF